MGDLDNEKKELTLLRDKDAILRLETEIKTLEVLADEVDTEE